MAKKKASTKKQKKVSTKKSIIEQHLLGEHVIVRTRVAGVYVGTLVAGDAANVVLKDARRLWAYYTNESTGAVSNVAESGLKEGANHSVGALMRMVALTSPEGLEYDLMRPAAYESVMKQPVA